MAQMEQATGGQKIAELEGEDAAIKMEDARVVNKKASKVREPAVTSIDLNEMTGTLTVESVNTRFV